ncbi:hypothetical protein [Neisseria weixii]|uniref:hypothetical protein n=1 Tax=Neisseria weixii TaxID=1853276 RepID=UPI0035A0F281
MKVYNTNRKAVVFILGFIAGYSSISNILPQPKKNTYGNIATDNNQLKGDIAKIGQDMYKATRKVMS